ncbi:hypothetical protein BofuT4_uP160510.1 [Botrytis cinerea T4]|uniref:Uncharacterized protein n=1 Tax=Botryotinia fuckeliana (strain T4) TaxID=999810 RepID=G2YTK2_BOTF4|nr:hypothetical protein BofuT4_uP160510.1 [Botrytis cinerea T4]
MRRRLNLHRAQDHVRRHVKNFADASRDDSFLEIDELESSGLTCSLGPRTFCPPTPRPGYDE